MRALHFVSNWLAVGLALSAFMARSEVPTGLPRAAVWLGDVTPGGPVFAREIGTLVAAAGWSIEYLDSAALTNVTRLDPGHYAMLVLPGARHLPIESVAAIESFLRGGGDLLALGLPAWDTPVFRVGDSWMTRADYEAKLDAQPPERMLIDFGAEDLSQWTRHVSKADTAASRAIVREGDRGALHVTVGGLDGWDTLEAPARPWAFPAGQTLTCFQARGSANTQQLAVEWVERDGSRWIASVDLKPEWRSYALPPEAFRPWQPPPGRGRAGDRLNVRDLARLTLGLALTHTTVLPGRQEYWVAALGSARSPFGESAPPPNPTLPRLESLAPGYQCYPITTPVAVRPPRWQAFLREHSGPLVGAGAASAAENAVVRGTRFLGLHPRPRGVGLGQDRPVRWQPILTARDSETEDYRGAIAALLVHGKPPFRGGVWAVFTPAEPEFYRQPEVMKWLGQVAGRMRSPVFLKEGGSEFFTVFPEQTVRVGARVLNLGAGSVTNLQVLLSVIDQREGKLKHRHQQLVAVPAGATETIETQWKPVEWPSQGCVVAVQLLADGQVIDELYHELHRWQPKAQPQFIEARDGGLWLDGQRWKAHGVNYLPASGIGVANEYFEFWLGRGAYDPEVIERDLRRIQAMGLNAVSAFIYHRDLGAQHLLDFLFRCERLGLRVNLSLRPGTPMDFRWNEMKALIEHYRLAENDTVFAYDLAWEPSHFDHNHQQRSYASPWKEWVAQRYGTIEAAQQAWGEGRSKSQSPTAKRGAGEVEGLAVPTMQEITQDGPWRKRVVDYRTFLDDLLRRKYAEARRLVRSIDPHHPVSFRMQHAGDPTYNAEGMLPYDFYGLAGAVDLWEPEAYGRIGDWDQVKGGCFTAAYARLCDPSKPVVWAEMGYNVWDMNRGAPAAAKLDFAARYYRDFYRMLRESGADGVFFWWYPGGFRLNENSDFGILNPDGTDRAVTRAIRDEGATFRAAPKPPPPNHWIRVDRDRDARGLYGIYQATQAEYWQAVEAGKRVGLSWARE